MLEDDFRRAMLMARGDLLRLSDDAVASTLLVLSPLLAVWIVWSTLRGRRAAEAGTEPGTSPAAQAQ